MSVQKNSSTVHWRIGLDLTYLVVDPAKEQLLGIPEGSLSGSPLTHCMHPEDAALLHQALDHASISNGLTGCTVRYVCPGGTHTITTLDITPVRDAHDNITGFAGRERCVGVVDTHSGMPPTFEAIFARAFVAFCLIDREGRLRTVNSQYARLTGRPTNELVRCHVGEMGVPTLEMVHSAFALFDAGERFPEREIIHGGKDYAISAFGLPNACGDITSICVFMRDISVRKGLERRLEAANRTLEEMNAKDYLTGVFNRRHFDETLHKEMARLAREGGVMCVGMVDVDNFKLYNDAYGHLAGDECLARVAQAMGAALLRPADEIFRYGGEEFAIVMPQTSKENALNVAERVREAVAGLRIPHCQTDYGVVTVSIGVAGIDAASARFGHQACEKLIRVADKALYRAKDGGRNKVDSDLCSVDGIN